MASLKRSPEHMLTTGILYSLWKMFLPHDKALPLIWMFCAVSSFNWIQNKTLPEVLLADCFEGPTWTVWEVSCTAPAESNIPWAHPDGYRVMSLDKLDPLSQSSRLSAKSKQCKEVTPRLLPGFVNQTWWLIGRNHHCGPSASKSYKDTWAPQCCPWKRMLNKVFFPYGKTLICKALHFPCSGYPSTFCLQYLISGFNGASMTREVLRRSFAMRAGSLGSHIRVSWVTGWESPLC